MTAAGSPQTVHDAVDNRNGYRGPIACAVADITYRQLDYWCGIGLVTPSVRRADGSGTQRLYGIDDIVRLSAARHLLAAGMALASVRRHVDELLEAGVVTGPATDQGATAVAVSLNVRAIRTEVLKRLDQPAENPPPIVAQPTHVDVMLPGQPVASYPITRDGTVLLPPLAFTAP